MTDRIIIRESTVDGVTFRYNEKDGAWERVSGSMDPNSSIYYFDDYGMITEIYEKRIEHINNTYESSPRRY